jgi:hypothetical protein
MDRRADVRPRWHRRPRPIGSIALGLSAIMIADVAVEACSRRASASGLQVGPVDSSAEPTLGHPWAYTNRATARSGRPCNNGDALSLQVAPRVPFPPGPQ